MTIWNNLRTFGGLSENGGYPPNYPNSHGWFSHFPLKVLLWLWVYFQTNLLKQPARINLGVLRWIHSVEPPGSGAAVTSVQKKRGGLDILNPQMSARTEREREREREREYSLHGDLHEVPFPKVLKSLKSSDSKFSNCPSSHLIPFHWLGSTVILSVGFTLGRIPIWVLICYHSE